MIDETVRLRNGEKMRKHNTANPPINATRINVSHKPGVGRSIIAESV
jgi:hypothetical protein